MAGVDLAEYVTIAEKAISNFLVEDSISERAEAVIKLSIGLVLGIWA